MSKKRKKFRSIRIKFVAYLMIIVIALGLAIGSSSAFIISDKLLTEQSQFLEENARLNGEQVRDYIVNELSIVEAVAGNAILTDLTASKEERVKIMMAEAQKFGYERFNMVDKKGHSTFLIPQGGSVDVKDRDYFKNALSGKANFQGPLVSSATGKLIMIFAAPIKVNNQVVGVLYGTKSGTFLSEKIKKLEEQYGENLIAYVLDKDGKIIGAKADESDFVLEQKNIFEVFSQSQDKNNIANFIKSDVLEKQSGYGTRKHDGSSWTTGYSQIGDWGWRLIISRPRNILMSAVRTLIVTVSIVILVSILIGSLVAYIIGTMIAKPLLKTTEHANRLKNLDLRGQIDESTLNRNDEIGLLASAFKEITENFRELVHEIQTSSHVLESSAGALENRSIQISGISEEIARTVGELAEGAMNQATDTESGAGNMVTLGDSIQLSVKNNEQLKESFEEIHQSVSSGLETIENLTLFTNESKEASGEIFDIIRETETNAKQINDASDLIANIADQTNLLALNAAIEAARAGETGRGFAVVAEEIRKLAEESAQSANTINDIVKSLNSNASKAVSTMETVGSVVDRQSESVQETEDKYKNISESLTHSNQVISMISTQIETMESGKNNVVGILESLAAIAEENAASTEEVSASTQEQAAQIGEISGEAKKLVEVANALKQEISKFTL